VTGEERIAAAKELVERSFDAEMKSEFTDGTIDAALRLCEKNGGLLVGCGMLLAFFRYWADAGEAVEAMDWGELEQMNLRNGPVLHVVAFIAPQNGYQIFRRLIVSMNPWGVSAHRWNKRLKQWRFTALCNARFDDEPNMELVAEMSRAFLMKMVAAAEQHARVWQSAAPGKWLN
jgi:hypothetical protein